MGWLKRIGKNIEREVKRVESKASAEAGRFVERIVSDSADESPSTSQAAVAQNNTNVVEAQMLNKVEPVQNNPPQIIPVADPPLPALSPPKVAALPPVAASNINPERLKPGHAFIVNHRTFLDTALGERIGSEMDLKRLDMVLTSFQLTTKTIPDGTLQDVEITMATVESFDFSTHSCLILIIMTHGYESDMLAAKDGRYSLHKQVLYPILRNSTLVGKPKLLFVQSCKGLTDLTLITDASIDISAPTQIPDEILQFHSCVEGYVSYRSPTYGSVFIQILCEKLTALGQNADIRAICNEVITSVKQIISDKQIPMVHTNLTKDFVLGHYKTNEVANEQQS